MLYTWYSDISESRKPAEQTGRSSQQCNTSMKFHCWRICICWILQENHIWLPGTVTGVGDWNHYLSACGLTQEETYQGHRAISTDGASSGPTIPSRFSPPTVTVNPPTVTVNLAPTLLQHLLLQVTRFRHPRPQQCHLWDALLGPHFSRLLDINILEREVW